MRLERFLRPGKSLLRTSESSLFLNSIIWGLISLYFDVLKKKLFLTESWKLMLNFSSFLSEAVEAAWGQKSFKWLIRHKFPLLRKPLSISFWWICQNIWSSLVFTLCQFLIVDPVTRLVYMALILVASIKCFEIIFIFYHIFIFQEEILVMVIPEDQCCSESILTNHTTKLELLVMALERVASVNQQSLPELQLFLFGFIQILNPNFGFYILILYPILSKI